jgi:hypothetical protein
MRFAENPPLVYAAAGYLGEWPVLTTVGIYVSPPTGSAELEKSQLYHVDDMDKTIVKCFINVNPVGPENGPFTFIPADKSERIRAKLGHRWRGARLTDEQVMAHASPEDVIELTGQPGCGALVDTARCLHFGSRCLKGQRAVIMVNYARRDNFMGRKPGDNREGMALLFNGH